MTTFSTDSMPWIEKYRPTEFDDIVLDPLNRIFFKHIVDKQHFPNLLFYGPPGTGKTTTIINLINEYQSRYTRINRETVIHLNASDERGIDIIRTQIFQFVRSSHIFESGYKFVILDEVDYMTKNAQQSLKTLLQTCRGNVRFCLICNYISKIDESLQQELICVRFNQLPGNEITKFIRRISEAESVSITDDEIDLMKETYHSDIRSMINFLQLTSSTGCLPSNKITSQTHIVSAREWLRIYDMLQSSASTEQEIVFHFQQLSRVHNLDVKQILLNFMHFVVTNCTNDVTEPLLEVFEETSHTKDDLRSHDLLYFFVSNCKPLLSKVLTMKTEEEQKEQKSSQSTHSCVASACS